MYKFVIPFIIISVLLVSTVGTVGAENEVVTCQVVNLGTTAIVFQSEFHTTDRTYYGSGGEIQPGQSVSVLARYFEWYWVVDSSGNEGAVFVEAPHAGNIVVTPTVGTDLQSREVTPGGCGGLPFLDRFFYQRSLDSLPTRPTGSCPAANWTVSGAGGQVITLFYDGVYQGIFKRGIWEERHPQHVDGWIREDELSSGGDYPVTSPFSFDWQSGWKDSISVLYVVGGLLQVSIVSLDDDISLDQQALVTPASNDLIQIRGNELTDIWYWDRVAHTAIGQTVGGTVFYQVPTETITLNVGCTL